MKIKMSKKVSIIIPAYNAGEYITKCINSLINQSYKNIEIIVIDDGSTDNTVSVCKSFNNEFIKVVSQKNSGPSCARNKGIEIATGKYLLFIDADDYLSYDSIEMMLKEMDSNSIVKVNFDYEKNNIVSINDKKIYGRINSNDYINGIINNNYPGFVWGTLFDKKIMGDLRFDTNTSFMEDAIFLVEYLKKIDNVIYTKGTYFYVQNSSSITSNSDKVLQNIINIDYSLQKIGSILNEPFKIQFKKIKLIEKEIAKITDYNKIKDVINNIKFVSIIDNIDLKNISSKLYKIIYLLYKKKCYFIIYMMLIIRRILKKMKNGE